MVFVGASIQRVDKWAWSEGTFIIGILSFIVGSVFVSQVFGGSTVPFSERRISNFWVQWWTSWWCSGWTPFGRKTHRKTSKDHIVSPVLIGILRVPLQCHSFQEIRTMMMNTLPPIIMEVEDDPIIEETSLGGTHGPNFHDYGRKEVTPFSWPLFPWGVGIGGVSLDSRVQFITWAMKKKPGCLGYLRDFTIQLYIRIIIV